MQQQSISPKGALTFWTPEPVPVEQFADALTSAGFAGCIPNPRSDRNALEASIKEVYGTKDKLVRPRKKAKEHGVMLVEEEKEEDVNHYVPSFGAKVQEGQVVTDYGYAKTGELQDQFDAAKATFTSAAVSKALVDILGRLQGSRPLKPGVYWLPPDSIAPWEAVAQAVEASKAATVVRVTFDVMDPSLANAILDGFAEEVNGEVEEILEALSKGTLSQDGIEVRKERATALLDKITVYADALDADLQDLRRLANVAKGAAVRAAMKNMPTLQVAGV